MPDFSAIDISASALRAERFRMELIAQNIANVNTTRTAEGGPYKRKEAVFSSLYSDQMGFARSFDPTRKQGVGVANVVVDQSPPKLLYNPDHPDAGADGFVRMPNINPVSEMVNMIAASRAYEANIAAIQNYRRMADKAMTIGHM
ncbi:flagellar basal body rod protein FlgC [Candidatus Poribacteria bacterium]|jgi:flagellar basal-body rod protein FlgC|nr:flagellar basal body rod protein FlgC [Candidatus Poribacteria bacterium]MBT5532308.1 flagellar basal body rod protein FlgC [Candidatus Poribacteria bacterium]MBT7098702.1 flagellar basal body rod protein FlgC [Candidatus Poribacteria bacterium]MBT7804844.1 flagellar basal body rod protein FlgC [Candidatus Poribacteria bacterium]